MNRASPRDLPVDVLVDLRKAQAQSAGTGVYIRELAQALSEHVSVRGMVSSRLPEIANLPFPVTSFAGFRPGPFDVWATRQAVRQGTPLISISRIPSLLAPRLAIPIIFDATPALLRGTHPPVRAFLERRTYPVAARSATILTISQTSRRDLITHLRLKPDRICVVVPGRSPSMSAEPRTPPPARVPAGAPYVLYLGTIEPRKNLTLLIDALERLPGTDLRLVVAGGLGWKYGPIVERLRPLVQRGVAIQLGYVSDDERVALYQHALCLAYPSLYEGFGLPLLEAMGCGTPVLTSTTPACLETVGSAGLTLDPADPDAWAAAIRRVCADSGLRATLSNAGRARARQFDWHATVRPLLDRLWPGRIPQAAPAA